MPHFDHDASQLSLPDPAQRILAGCRQQQYKGLGIPWQPQSPDRRLHTGRRIFQEALAAGTLEGFFQLVEQFRCGPAVLRAGASWLLLHVPVYSAPAIWGLAMLLSRFPSAADQARGAVQVRSSGFYSWSLRAAAASTCVLCTSHLVPGHVAQTVSICCRSSCRYPTRLRGICVAGAPVKHIHSHTRPNMPGPACHTSSVACLWLQSSMQMSRPCAAWPKC